MSAFSHGSLPFLVGVLLAAAIAAAPPQPEPASGFVRRGDALMGTGPGYSLRCDAEGLRLATTTEAPGSLAWRTASIGRGAQYAVATVAPRVTAPGRVEFLRGSVTERYQLRIDGVEQSYVFTELPPGAGDLVVRLEWTTDLAASVADRDVPSLTFAGRDATLSIGAVTGIDANGRRGAGWMRYVNGTLELVLPDDFVEDAALPLVLDPLIGPTFPVSLGASPFYGPPNHPAFLRYDASRDEIWVAGSSYSGFFFHYSADAWHYDLDGTYQGSTFLAGAHFADAFAEGLAYVHGQAAVVVGYRGGAGYYPTPVSAAVIDAASGQRRGEVRLPHSISAMVGESTPTGDRALVAGNGQISIVRVAPSGAPSIERTVFAGTGAMALSHGGTAGRFLLVWTGSSAVHGVVLDRDLTVLDSGVIVTGSGRLRRNPTVDGNGDHWVVAYEAVPEGGGAPDIGCIPLSWDAVAGTAQAGAEVFPAASAAAETEPRVAWVGGSYLLAYEGDQQTTHALTIDPYTCAPCEAEEVVFTKPANQLLVASQRQADAANGGDLAFVVMVGEAQLFATEDGVVTDLGGGCGQGGRAAATCARVAHGAFSPRLRSARPGVPAFLLLGTQAASTPCGACAIVASPQLVAAAGLTNAHGDAALPLPIPALPSLRGAALVQQWATPGAGCSLGVDLSNGQRVEIQ
ncbi:MAG: hypothetical protein AAF628_23370 [Planctomycetota bacterium]